MNWGNFLMALWCVGLFVACVVFLTTYPKLRKLSDRKFLAMLVLVAAFVALVTGVSWG